MVGWIMMASCQVDICREESRSGATSEHCSYHSYKHERRGGYWNASEYWTLRIKVTWGVLYPTITLALSRPVAKYLRVYCCSLLLFPHSITWQSSSLERTAIKPLPVLVSNQIMIFLAKAKNKIVLHLPLRSLFFCISGTPIITRVS